MVLIGMGNVFKFFKCFFGEEEKICEKVVIYGFLKRIFLILNNENYLNILCKVVFLGLVIFLFIIGVKDIFICFYYFFVL